MSTYAQLADMLFPHVKRQAEEIIALYPPRKLPAGAMVARLAPSPHRGAAYRLAIRGIPFVPPGEAVGRRVLCPPG